MMTDQIDRALQGLAAMAVPEMGADFEARVMARIAGATAARATRPSITMGLGTFATALAVGVITAIVPFAPADDGLQLSVFSARAALAPATLLATAE